MEIKEKTEQLINENIEWATNEIERLKKKPDVSFQKLLDEHDKCLDDALYLYHNFMMKIKEMELPEITKKLFLELINNNPLSEIEDNDEDWDKVDTGTLNNDMIWEIYQCKRYPSLFKKVLNNDKDKKTVYTDEDRVICVDINTKEEYQDGIGLTLLDEMIPIKMPYFPSESDKILAFVERFYAYDGDNNNAPELYDTFGILHFKIGDFHMVKVMRFFKKDYVTKEIVEIDRQEYFARRSKCPMFKNEKEKK